MHSLESLQQLERSLDVNPLIVIDFHAPWCEPCKRIAPVIEKLGQKVSDVCFLKCDVDACRDIAELFQITSLPTFAFIDRGLELNHLRVRGASIEPIKHSLKNLLLQRTTQT
jgi:thioredoxin 1